MNILVIDDDCDVLAMVQSRLANECVDLFCAERGEAGLELARRVKPDLILLDVKMPDVSGFDICRALKTDADLCMIPVIFLSASSSADDKVKGLDLGAVDYVTKPFDGFELRARVRAALRTKHLQDLLIEHAHIDPLTGLPNRRALMARLLREWARIERHGGTLSFVMADIDHFKRVNDSYGHGLGDQMLQEIARSIAGQCREVDLPGRYGGEEFAIIVPDESAVTAAHLAERCRRQIEAIRLPAGSQTIRATASFGVAEVTGIASAEALVACADRALYQAKGAGRNRVELDQSSLSCGTP